MSDPEPNRDRLLTAKEAAEILGVTVYWIHEHAISNDLPHIKLGRYRRFRRADLDQYIEDHCQGGKAWTR